MPYIAFELDALAKVPYVAAAAGVDPAKITHGLANLWAWCWKAKSAVVTDVHLRGFFGCDAAASLTAFNFLELIPLGFRVRGAERYLRVSAARSKGGHAAKGNLNRGRKSGPAKGVQPAGSAGSQPESSREPAGEQPENSPGCGPALSSSIEHRASTTSLPAASAPGEFALEPAPPTKTDRPTARKEKPTDPRRAPLSDAMVADFLDARGAAYDFDGGRDGKALSELLTKGPDEEIRSRWRKGLNGAGFYRVSSFAQLAAKWNDITGNTGPPLKTNDIRKSPVRAEDIPRSSFAKTGPVDGF